MLQKHVTTLLANIFNKNYVSGEIFFFFLILDNKNIQMQAIYLFTALLYLILMTRTK